MPYLASRHSPETEQPAKPVTQYRDLGLSIASLVFAVGVVSICVLSIIGS